MSKYVVSLYDGTPPKCDECKELASARLDIDDKLLASVCSRCLIERFREARVIKYLKGEYK